MPTIAEKCEVPKCGRKIGELEFPYCRPMPDGKMGIMCAKCATAWDRENLAEYQSKAIREHAERLRLAKEKADADDRKREAEIPESTS